MSDPNDPDETPDHEFDSAPLGGVNLLDRLFIENAHAGAGFFTSGQWETDQYAVTIHDAD